MKKIFKRISAAVIALAVVLTALVFEVPETVVHAATTASDFSALKTAVANGGTVTITSDITFTECITVNKSVTILSQGNHTLKRGSSFTGNFFSVTAGTLTLDGGVGSNNTLTIDGGAVWSGTKDSILGRGTNNTGRTVSSELITAAGTSTVTLKNSVTLQNNYNNATSGDSAIILYDTSTLNINGAVIRDNYAKNGTAVKTTYGATVNMTEGEIYGNYSGKHGGAMQIYGRAPYDETDTSASYCNISGGKIHNNLSPGVGGAIAVSNFGHLTLSGNTEIYGNQTTDWSKRGGGVGFIDADTTLDISGSVKIYNNFDKDNKANNLTIGTNSNNKITLNSLSGAKIGVTYNQSSADTSSSFANTNSTDYSGCFYSDRDGYIVEYRSQGLYLKRDSCSHSWDSGTVTTPVSCSTPGVKTYTCTQCHTIKTEVVPTTSHTYTYTYNGTQHRRVCSNCGYLATEWENHSGGTATCQTKAACSKCGQEYGNLGAHSTTHTAAKAATCTANGNKEYWHCSNCNKNFTTQACTTEITNTVIAKTGHSYNTTWSKDVTNHWHECTSCGDKKDTAAHSGGTATCQTKAICTVCGEKYGNLGSHSYSTTWSKDANQHWHTCSTSGCTSKSGVANHTFEQKKDGINHWQECSVCKYKKDVAAHLWSDWKLTKEPTLKETGAAERECDCGEKQTKTDVPKLTDPIWTKSDRTDPTLNGAGSEKYTSNDYGTVTIEIPKLSDETVWKKVVEACVPATEEEDGKDVYTSDDYGDVTVVLPALEHTHEWGDWTITAEPTLTATGTAQRVGTKNDMHIDTITLPALTDTGVWTKVEHVGPTEQAEGKDVYTSEYGEVTVTLDKLPHEHKLTHVDEVPATEEKEGKKEHWHCEGCGKDFFDENSTNEATADDLKIGKIETEVQAPVNVEIATPKEELITAALTEEEQKKVDEGTDIKIILKVEDVSESVPAKDKTAVEAAIGNLTDHILGQYLDVTLLKKIGGQQEQKVTNTNKPITITFEIPENLRGKAKYSVIRVHNGETTVLEDKDNNPDTVTIETDKFSTYALTYQDTPSDPSEGNPGDSSDPSTSTPNESDNSDVTSGENNSSSDTTSSGNGTSTDTSDTNSSGGTSSSDESIHAPSESSPSEDNGNPSTGIAVSLIPLVTAAAILAAILTVAVKCKKK